MSQVVDCPHCGVRNEVTRSYCRICFKALVPPEKVSPTKKRVNKLKALWNIALLRWIAYSLLLLFLTPVPAMVLSAIWVWRRLWISILILLVGILKTLLGKIIELTNIAAGGNDTNVNSTKKNSKTIYPSLEDEKKDKAEDKSQIGYFENK